MVRKDPDVVAVASFIGADGTNPTTNSGRISDHPQAARRAPCQTPTQIIARLQPKLGRLARHRACTSRRCRTSRSTPRRAAPRTSTPWKTPTRPSSPPGRRSSLEKLRTLPELRTWPPTSRDGGPASLSTSTGTRPRASASPPQAIDDTLYDAFGQRQVSTIFTQLNLYRVILEVNPGVPERPGRAARPALRALRRRQPGAALGGGARFADARAPLAVNHQGQFPVGDPLLQPGARSTRSGEAVRRDPQRRPTRSVCPRLHAAFQGTAQAFRESLGQRAVADPRGADHRLHRAGRALRELHPSDHHPLHAALGRRGRAPGADASAGRSSASSR